jgi:hypothetical protein
MRLFLLWFTAETGALGSSSRTGFVIGTAVVVGLLASC